VAVIQDSGTLFFVLVRRLGKILYFISLYNQPIHSSFVKSPPQVDKITADSY